MTMKKQSMNNLESAIAISRYTIKPIKILHILLAKPTANFLSIVTGQTKPVVHILNTNRSFGTPI